MNLKVDRLLLATLLGILGLALVNLQSATLHRPSAFDAQVVWLGLAMLALAVAVYVPSSVVDRLSPLAWVAVVVLLVMVLVMGTKVNGAKRWLSFGALRIQPSEFAKLGVIFLLAHTMSRSRSDGAGWSLSDLLGPLNPSRPVALVGLLIWRGERLGQGYYPLAALALVWFVLSVVALSRNGLRGRIVAPLDTILVPMVLINIEPDLGTSLVVLVCGLGVFWGAGVQMPPKRALLAVSPLPFVGGWFAWNFMLLDYQKARVLGVLNPEADAQHTGYHTIQSINAIANGGVFGRGLGAGAQAQTARLPEHHTDFIFAVLAEEWGLLGSLLALLLLFTLVLLIIDGARHTPDRFLELSGYGIASLIVFQVVVNVGMVSGIMPVVGMTLPFFSKGGSSLVSLCFAVGLMIQARSSRASGVAKRQY
ncbi:MAG: FtsW/RodA/SpoVE family cell cycle protein [Myxococcota bacterium]|nr:FtsW/RodA/SpoVE family cell cycle protein [Myxococcota bacterium]